MNSSRIQRVLQNSLELLQNRILREFKVYDGEL